MGIYNSVYSMRPVNRLAARVVGEGKRKTGKKSCRKLTQKTVQQQLAPPKPTTRKQTPSQKRPAAPAVHRREFKVTVVEGKLPRRSPKSREEVRRGNISIAERLVMIEMRHE